MLNVTRVGSCFLDVPRKSGLWSSWSSLSSVQREGSRMNRVGEMDRIRAMVVHRSIGRRGGASDFAYLAVGLHSFMALCALRVRAPVFRFASVAVHVASGDGDLAGGGARQNHDLPHPTTNRAQRRGRDADEITTRNWIAASSMISLFSFMGIHQRGKVPCAHRDVDAEPTILEAEKSPADICLISIHQSARLRPPLPHESLGIPRLGTRRGPSPCLGGREGEDRLNFGAEARADYVESKDKDVRATMSHPSKQPSAGRIRNPSIFPRDPKA
ncbi:hypothetical protein K438DRAFT_2078721 [Mycena galopus ATCC 62051]|nr:hypothetical protein K438DRAFT_2078721 [Mycena galopus ATCC 62051]